MMIYYIFILQLYFLHFQHLYSDIHSYFCADIGRSQSFILIRHKSSGMRKTLFLIISLLIILFFGLNLTWGSVEIPLRSIINILTLSGEEKSSWEYIILYSRLPQAITATLAGAALACSGLLLQTIFNNPLAGPSILGVDSGAGLGVALTMMFFGGTIGGIAGLTTVSGYFAIIISAFIGSGVILAAIIFFSTIIKSNLMLLITGIMIGYLTSALVSILNFFSSEKTVFAYTIWGMGDFSSVSLNMLPVFGGLIFAGLILALLLIKPRNGILLGERYAENLGVNVRLLRVLIFLSTGILTAVTTAFCGPVSFIGLAVPHVARMMFKTSNNKVLMPATILCGSAICLLCNLASNCPGYSYTIPLNAITALIGAPVIIYVIITQRSLKAN